MSNIILNALDKVEQIGNKLPHPVVLFIWMCAFVVALSALLNGYSVVHPVTDSEVMIKSLASGWGLREMLTNAVKNFTGFAPVGTVIVAIMGIAFAEQSGLISVLLRSLVAKAKRSLITFIVVIAGVLSSIAADAGYVVLIPLAGMVFHSIGRSPLVGMAAAFAGVSGGFSANLVIGPVDVILAGLSTEALKLDSSIAEVVSPASNYYFMIASVFFVGVVATWITEKIVSPRYEKNITPDNKEIEIHSITALEKKALAYSALASVVFIGLCLMLVVPDNGLLRNPQTGGFLKSPFMSGIVQV